MDDYYKILGLKYNATITDISNTYHQKILEYKLLPFLTDKDKTEIKNLKKAYFVLSNNEYKQTYDKSLSYFLSQKNKPINTFSPVGICDDNNFSPWTTTPIIPTEKQNFTINRTPEVLNKKSGYNPSYISNRIFGLNNNNVGFNISNSEMLKPKNAGLSSDKKIDN
jgi:curved DNA-binding protein CbpA